LCDIGSQGPAAHLSPYDIASYPRGGGPLRPSPRCPAAVPCRCG